MVGRHGSAIRTPINSNITLAVFLTFSLSLSKNILGVNSYRLCERSEAIQSAVIAKECNEKRQSRNLYFLRPNYWPSHAPARVPPISSNITPVALLTFSLSLSKNILGEIPLF